MGGIRSFDLRFKSARCQWLQSRVWLDGLFVTRCPLHTEANDRAMWLGRFGCLIAESRGQQADAERNILGCRQLGSIGPLWSRVGGVLHPIDVASPMSRLGQTRTSRFSCPMSVSPPRADMQRPMRHVRSVPRTDIRHASQSLENAVIWRPGHLAFWGEVSACTGENAREGTRWKDCVRDRCSVRHWTG